MVITRKTWLVQIPLLAEDGSMLSRAFRNEQRKKMQDVEWDALLYREFHTREEAEAAVKALAEMTNAIVEIVDPLPLEEAE